MDISIVAVGALVVLIILVVVKTATVVPQQSQYIVERLGKYAGTLDAGFHILVPFLDSIRYKHSLKERAMDIPEQICITSDNVQVGVDGVLYFKVMDAKGASYGIGNYVFAITQLAQTTLRSEIGKIELDKTFEERAHINNQVVDELDKATASWGVKVLRYEIKNINPPRDVLAAMEKQTEATKQQQINEAQGEAAAITTVATATAEGIRKVAKAIESPGGYQAVQLRVAEQYVEKLGLLAKENNTMILPSNLADVSSVIATAMNVIRHSGDRKREG